MLTQTDAEKLGFLWCGKEFCQPWPYSNKSSPDRGFDPFGGGGFQTLPAPKKNPKTKQFSLELMLDMSRYEWKELGQRGC